MSGHAQISFLRATPPAVPLLEQSVRGALEQAVSQREGRAELFRHHRFEGTPIDKESAAKWLAQRISAATLPDRILVTNGTMNSLLLLLATLVGANGVLATEAMTFPQVKVIASLFGIRLVGIDCDGDGLRPDAFEAACSSGNAPRALYCNPTIQSPTATVMTADRRRSIVEVARRHGVFIIEDEAQALYGEDIPPPMASLAPELTWYLMGLSKYLSLGVRAAFVVAPSRSDAQAVLARVRTLSTWHVAPLVAQVVTSWIQDDIAHRLFGAARDEIHARQALVRKVFHDVPQFRGSQGLHFWLAAPPGCSGDRFTRAAAAAGVLVRSSDLYAVGDCPAIPGIRPAIGDPATRDELLHGLRILRSVFEKLHHVNH